MIGLSRTIASLCIAATAWNAGASTTITVVDDNQAPVAGASVTLGNDVSAAPAGSTGMTNSAGQVTLADGAGAQAVTVSAAGYISTTWPSAKPGAALSVQISKQEGANEIEIGGACTDYGNLSSDGYIDFGLVMPAMSRADLLGFDLSLVLSPQNDTLSAAGMSINLPSNIALPQQSETYIFFPVTISKPSYRVYVRSPGNYPLFATHGRFPFGPVVDAVRNGSSMYDLINQFSFTSGALTNVSVVGDSTGHMISLAQIPFDTRVHLTAPTLAAGQMMMGLSLRDENGLLLPTDIKRFVSGQSLDLAASGRAPSVLSVLIPDSGTATASGVANRILTPLWQEMPAVAHPQAAQDFSQMSFALQAGTGAGVTPEFLPLIAKPTWKAPTLSMTPPTLPVDLEAAGMYAVYSEIETITGGNVPVERRTRLWQVVSPTWPTHLTLPHLTFPTNPGRTYRWEVMYLARPKNISGSPSAGDILDLNGVTHVTRNTLDL